MLYLQFEASSMACLNANWPSQQMPQKLIDFNMISHDIVNSLQFHLNSKFGHISSVHTG